MKEVKLKWYAGPFESIPAQFEDDYIQSPIGLVPKDNGKDLRLIFHLSYPRVKTGQNSTSVNANTPKEQCRVKYPDFADTILRCLQEGQSCSMSKSDQRSAFRNLSILPGQWRYLLMRAKSPLDGKYYYFVDKCLPFGASISCAHFQKVSDAIAAIVEYKTSRKVTNYLDDYLFMAFLTFLCNREVEIFLETCEYIGMPVSPEKTVWAMTITTFLGFLIDSRNQVIGIPKEKITKAINMIESVLQMCVEKPASKRKIMVIQLQHICGFLNFLSRAIIPGRAFTQRLYSHLQNNNP